MHQKNVSRLLIILAIAALVTTSSLAEVHAHCDGLDGPVIKAAQKALQSGNVNLILIWVQKKDEGEIKNVFTKTLVVRELSPQAQELADMYLFETLVRIHRAGEGEPYTGLKPAGRDLGPAIPATDEALASGAVEPLLDLLISAMEEGVEEKFEQVMVKKNYNGDDIEAGRAYIESYVPFVTYIESIYESIRRASGRHPGELAEQTPHR
jgi:uncharacterized protein DUF6448